jgi:hypothetical protein
VQQASEYLPSELSPKPKPNGKHVPLNGDDSSDRFYAQLREERRVLTDAELHHGAVRLWFLILKFSWLRSFNEGKPPGTVAISRPVLGEAIGASNRAILKWRLSLEAKGYLWTSKRHLGNAWPLTEYHITAICPKPEGGPKPPPGGLWRGGTKVPAELFEAGKSQVLDSARPAGTKVPPRGNQSARPAGTKVLAPREPECSRDPAKCSEMPAAGEPECSRRGNQSARGAGTRVLTIGDSKSILGVVENGEAPQVEALPPEATPGLKPDQARWENLKQTGAKLGSGRFIRELVQQLDLVQAKIAAVRNDASNFRTTLAAEVKEAITWLRNDAERIKDTDPEKAAAYLADAEGRERNPINQVRHGLTPHAAAVMANLTRRKTDLETAIQMKEDA